MKKPSRHMPLRVDPSVISSWVLAVFSSAAVVFGLLIHWPITVCFALAIAMVFIWGSKTQRHIDSIVADRDGEGICTFARALDMRNLDPWVVRAVYEEVSEFVFGMGENSPLRPEDDLTRDLLLDEDDIDLAIFTAVAERTSRSLDGWETNPLGGRIETVKDLIYFFNAQPQQCQ